MSVVDVHKDTDRLTMTITAEYRAPVEHVWRLWADPRLLERWWGPPSAPATFVEHDMSPGGHAAYYMTGPDGAKHYGWWRIAAVDEQRSIELEDGFADEEGNPDHDLPTTRTSVTIEPGEDGTTRMIIQARFPSATAMEQMIEMGMDQGMQEALGQIDALLSELAIAEATGARRDR